MSMIGSAEKSPAITLQSPTKPLLQALEGSLVGRGAVDRRHRHVVESQIHAKLSAVVDIVTHHKASQRGDARQRKNGLTARQECPRFEQVFIARACDRGAGSGDIAVEPL